MPKAQRATARGHAAANAAPYGRGRGGSSRGGRRGARGRRKAYEAPEYAHSASLSFNSALEADFEAKLDSPGIKSIYFGPRFEIEDQHILAIASRPHLAARLEKLSLGDADTGNGGRLTDAVIALLDATPNLRVLLLEACTHLTHAVLIAAVTKCPQLEQIKLTGNDKVHGAINSKGLKELKTHFDSDAGAGGKLQELILYDQGTIDKEAKQLTKARKGLVVHTGNVGREGHGYEEQTSFSIYKNGKMVGIDMGFGEMPADDNWF